MHEGVLALIVLDVLLEPKAHLDVVTQQIGAGVLVRVEHDAQVAAAAQTARVRCRVARRVLLRAQVSALVGRHAVPRGNARASPRAAVDAAGLTHRGRGTIGAQAGAHASGREQHELRAVVVARTVVVEDLRRAESRDELQGRRHPHAEGVVLGCKALERARHDDLTNAIDFGVGDERDRRGKRVARAVLRLRAARANLLLECAGCVHVDRVWRVRHVLRVDPDAEPGVTWAAQGDGCEAAAWARVEHEPERDVDRRGCLATAHGARTLASRALPLGPGGNVEDDSNGTVVEWLERAACGRDRLVDGRVHEARVIHAERVRRLIARGGALDVGQGGVGRTASARQAHVEVERHLGLCVRIEDRVAGEALVARALEDAAVTRVRTFPRPPVARLFRFDPRLELRAPVDVIARRAAVAPARVDLHRRDVPRLRRLDELREAARVAVEALARLAAVPSEKNWDVGMSGSERSAADGRLTGTHLVGAPCAMWSLGSAGTCLSSECSPVIHIM